MPLALRQIAGNTYEGGVKGRFRRCLRDPISIIACAHGKCSPNPSKMSGFVSAVGKVTPTGACHRRANGVQILLLRLQRSSGLTSSQTAAVAAAVYTSNPCTDLHQAFPSLPPSCSNSCFRTRVVRKRRKVPRKGCKQALLWWMLPSHLQRMAVWRRCPSGRSLTATYFSDSALRHTGASKASRRACSRCARPCSPCCLPLHATLYATSPCG